VTVEIDSYAPPLELAAVSRKPEGLVDAIADGLRAVGLQQRLDDLESRKAGLGAQLAAPAPPPMRLASQSGAALSGRRLPVCIWRSPIPSYGPKRWS
jgi:hypothetical protein